MAKKYRIRDGFSFVTSDNKVLPGGEIVELDDEPDLRLTSRLVGVDPHAEVDWIGTRVRATFERVEDVWLPLFTPFEAR